VPVHASARSTNSDSPGTGRSSECWGQTAAGLLRPVLLPMQRGLPGFCGLEDQEGALLHYYMMIGSRHVKPININSL